MAATRLAPLARSTRLPKPTACSATGAATPSPALGWTGARHPLQAASLSPATIVLDVTPTQIALTLPGIMPGDTGFATYTRHGQELLMTFAPLKGEPVGLRDKGERSQIITLMPTLFRMEKMAGRPGEMHRTRYFYHGRFLPSSRLAEGQAFSLVGQLSAAGWPQT